MASMLSTKDNPFNPFKQFDDWYRYDFMHGHKSCELLGHYAKTSSELSNADNDAAIDEAIKEIILNDYEDKFIRVSE